MYLMYYEDDAGKRVYTLEVESLTPFCNSMYSDGTGKTRLQSYASEVRIDANRILALGPDCYALEPQPGANCDCASCLLSAFPMTFGCENAE